MGFFFTILGNRTVMTKANWDGIIAEWHKYEYNGMQLQHRIRDEYFKFKKVGKNMTKWFDKIMCVLLSAIFILCGCSKGAEDFSDHHISNFENADVVENDGTNAIIDATGISGETVQDIEDDSIRDFVEESVRKQEELCSAAEGIWIFVDFFPLLTGAPSRDSAEDYLNKEISFSFSDGNELFLEFNNKKYQLVRVRPLAKRYLMGLKYSGNEEQIILDGYTCELLFESNDDSLVIYINEKGKLFLRIRDSVADHACFVLEKNIGDKMVEMNLAYFQNKAEYLIDEC
ncbi:MAG: hypothetical protein ACI4S2_16830, partial [Lachnospiraceae bacterium]